MGADETTPGTPATLLTAFLAFQGEAPKVQKAAINPHFKSKYVSLDALMGEVLPVLNRHGLVWVTLPVDRPEGPRLHYRLIHAASGESLDGEMPLMLSKEDAQGQGSAITYARRYSIMAVLGLVADEDDDGHKATQGRRTAQRPQNGGSAKSDVALLTAEQRAKVIKGIEESGHHLDLILSAVGVEASDDLTVAHALQIRSLIDGAA